MARTAQVDIFKAPVKDQLRYTMLVLKVNKAQGLRAAQLPLKGAAEALRRGWAESSGDKLFPTEAGLRVRMTASASVVASAYLVAHRWLQKR